MSAISTTTADEKVLPLLTVALVDQWQPNQQHASPTALLIRPIRNHIYQDNIIADIHTRSFDGNATEFWRQK